MFYPGQWDGYLAFLCVLENMQVYQQSLAPSRLFTCFREPGNIDVSIPTGHWKPCAFYLHLRENPRFACVFLSQPLFGIIWGAHCIWASHQTLVTRWWSRFLCFWTASWNVMAHFCVAPLTFPYVMESRSWLTFLAFLTHLKILGAWVEDWNSTISGWWWHSLSLQCGVNIHRSVLDPSAPVSS